MRSKRVLVGSGIVVTMTVMFCGAALAGNPTAIPAPGILGLVALGVIGAVALARHRK